MVIGRNNRVVGLTVFSNKGIFGPQTSGCTNGVVE